MPAGKLTIQAWHEEQARQEEWQKERDRQLDELGRAIESFVSPRRRRYVGWGERLARFWVG